MSNRTEIQTLNQQEGGRYRKVEEALKKMAKKMDVSSFVVPSPSVAPSSPQVERNAPATVVREEHMRSPRKARHPESSQPLSPSKLLRRVSTENTVVVNEGSVWYDTYTTVEQLPGGREHRSRRRGGEARVRAAPCGTSTWSVSPKPKKDVEDDAVCTCLPPSYAYSLLERSHGGGVGRALARGPGGLLALRLRRPLHQPPVLLRMQPGDVPVRSGVHQSDVSQAPVILIEKGEA